jgi:hypothetical protein
MNAPLAAGQVFANGWLYCDLRRSTVRSKLSRPPRTPCGNRAVIAARIGNFRFHHC